VNVETISEKSSEKSSKKVDSLAIDAGGENRVFDEAIDRRICKMPGCLRPVTLRNGGRGRQPAYCDDPDHNRIAAYHARQAQQAVERQRALESLGITGGVSAAAYELGRHLDDALGRAETLWTGFTQELEAFRDDDNASERLEESAAKARAAESWADELDRARAREARAAQQAERRTEEAERRFDELSVEAETTRNEAETLIATTKADAITRVAHAEKTAKTAIAEAKEKVVVERSLRERAEAETIRAQKEREVAVEAETIAHARVEKERATTEEAISTRAAAQAAWAEVEARLAAETERTLRAERALVELRAGFDDLRSRFSETEAGVARAEARAEAEEARSTRAERQIFELQSRLDDQVVAHATALSAQAREFAAEVLRLRSSEELQPFALPTTSVPVVSSSPE